MGKTRYNTILILGPTGSGKTPFGDICEEKGLWGKKCAHFDFGASLRKIAEAGSKPAFLSDEDMDVVNRVLRSGALLDNENFHIAEKILRSFAEEKNLGTDGLLVLNGLPRHAGQADDVDDIAAIEAVVHLRCSPEVVGRRIQLNSGGDRAGRIDDSPGEIERKLKLFEERTFPLIEHYSGRKAAIWEYDIQVETTPAEIYEWFNGNWGKRAKRSNDTKFQESLAKIPDVEPEEFDRL